MRKPRWLTSLTAIGLITVIAGCTPEVGSDKWCVMMKEKPKADWTANEAGDYAQHCLL